MDYLDKMVIKHHGDSLIDIYIPFDKRETFHLAIDIEKNWFDSMEYVGFRDLNGRALTEFMYGSGIKYDDIQKTSIIFENLSNWIDSLTDSRRDMLYEVVDDGLLIPADEYHFTQLKELLNKKTLHQRIKNKWFKEE